MCLCVFMHLSVCLFVACSVSFTWQVCLPATASFEGWASASLEVAPCWAGWHASILSRRMCVGGVCVSLSERPCQAG